MMMADPQAVKDDTYAVLMLARKKLNSATFLFELRSASAAERDQALHAITDVALATQVFRRARLDAIEQEMKGQDAGIIKATGDLRKALAHLETIKPILDGATALLKIVARIIAVV
jgi:hypothetical protein